MQMEYSYKYATILHYLFLRVIDLWKMSLKLNVKAFILKFYISNCVFVLIVIKI